MTPEVRLLLVEDSPADVFLVKEALREEGLKCQVEVVEDGESALAMLDRVDARDDLLCPDVLLIDLNLPRVDGVHVLQRLRRSPRCGNVPAIVISSSDSRADREHARELGANEYFLKPSNLADFLRLGKLIRAVYERHSRAD